MAQTKTRRRRRVSTKDKLQVYGFLFLIFLSGFVIGWIVKPQKIVEVPVETVVEVSREVVSETANTSSPIEEEEIVKEEKVVYFDCPLDEETQDYIFELCAEEDIPPSMVIAFIDKESNFTPSVVSETADYGYMQINECNHEWLTETYGITDFLDPKDNIFCGVKILANLYHKYENPHEIAMAYNMGEYGAKQAWEKGLTSTSYSEDVVELWYMYEVDHEMEVQRGKSNN